MLMNLIQKFIEPIKRFYMWRNMVTIEVQEISYESHRAILTEWKDQNAWLPRHEVRIKREDGKVLVSMPQKLFKRKFTKDWD